MKNCIWTFAGIWLFIGLPSLLLADSGAVEGKASKATHLRLLIPLYGPEEIALADRYLQAGDMVVVYPPRPELMASGQPTDPDHWLQRAKEFKANHPEIETIFNFDGIDKLREWLPRLPPEIDWVSYDYERWQSTPEYGSAEEHILKFFEEGRLLAHQYGKRLFLTPVPFYSDYAIDWAVSVNYLPERMKAWDFGALASRGDAINAQFQFFLRDLDWLGPTVRSMSAELKEEAPNTLFLVQVGPGPGRERYTEKELEDAVGVIHGSGVDALAIWYGPGQTGWGEKVLQMIRGRP